MAQETLPNTSPNSIPQVLCSFPLCGYNFHLPIWNLPSLFVCSIIPSFLLCFLTLISLDLADHMSREVRSFIQSFICSFHNYILIIRCVSNFMLGTEEETDKKISCLPLRNSQSSEGNRCIHMTIMLEIK